MPPGASPVANLFGVTVRADNNQLVENVVSGNTDRGIQLDGASDNTLTSNLIGTDADGTHAVPNFNGGVHILGGTTAADTNTLGANVISGNDGPGVLIEATTADAAQGNKFTSNIIGTTARNTHRPLGNSGPGVTIADGSGAGKNTIGDNASTAGGNTIAFNLVGIVAGTGTSQNTFVRNSIRDNGGAGIELRPGANDDIASPLLSTATRDGNDGDKVHVTGTYTGTPDTAYQLDFYASDACGGGSTNGDTWLGSVLQVTNGSGDLDFDSGALAYAEPAAYITATATDPNGSTSELSVCRQLAEQAAGATFTVTTNADTSGTCAADPDPGDCTLRQAINSANALPGTDTIAFNLPGSTKISITDQPSDPFPAITDDVVIDGETQPGTTPGKPVVQVDGVDAPSQGVGLDIAGGFDGSTIRGLSVTGFSQWGIELEGPPSVVTGNYVGLAPDGTAQPNGSNTFSFEGGIDVRSDNNHVGGSTDGDTKPHLGEQRHRYSVRERDGQRRHRELHRNGPERRRSRSEHLGRHALRGRRLPVRRRHERRRGQPDFRKRRRRDLHELGLRLRDRDVRGEYDRRRSRTEGRRCRTAAQASGSRASTMCDIGGTAPGAGNVISGNAGPGVVVSLATGTTLQGNRIGTSSDGLSAAPNATAPGSGAQLVIDDANDTVVGGTTLAALNFIGGGGSGPAGIHVTDGSTGTTVQGNNIGLAADGESALGNGDGVVIDGFSDDTTVGGVAPGARNVISGNSLDGVRIDTAGSGTKVLGNTIGADRTETTVAGLGNDIGIDVTNTSLVTIGSTSPGGGNVIGGSDDTGILIFAGSTGTTIAGNYVGTDRSDSVDLGNVTGIRLVNGENDDNLIGPNNVIAHSGDFGIEMDNGVRNRFSANSIHDNGAEGIHLAGGGSNNDQQAPTLTSALKTGATTNVSGKLDSAPSTSYFVEYFATPTCTGEPQGQLYLGFETVTTNASGQANLSFGTTFPSLGYAMTATATNASTRDTSEFSQCATVATDSVQPGPDYTVNTADDHADPGGCTFGDCSLREAIDTANANGAPLATISFAIPGSGTHQISVTEVPLPDITTPVVIDGTTQPGFTSRPLIVLDGSSITDGDEHGLVLAAGSDGSTLEGLGVQNFSAANYPLSAVAGIRVISSDNRLEGLSVGTSADGLSAQPNDIGIAVTGSRNTIGDPSGNDGNVISGNRSYGIHVDGTVTGAHDNAIAGNLVGTDVTGNVALPNDTSIAADNATTTMIGGLSTSAGNVVFGSSIGIDVNGTLGTFNASEIRFNSVGIGRDGVTGLGQSGAWAVGVSKSDGVVVADNVIGHGETGLVVAGSSDATIVRNAVGTDRLGLGDHANTLEGIYVQQFGAPTPPTGIVIGSSGNGNIVRNNPLTGIKLENIDQSSVAGNTVRNNGGDGAPGIGIQGNGNTIGPDNVVRNNGTSFTGIDVLSGVGNTITQNSIDANVGLGIDLGADGVTPNDASPDADSGPNNLQNFPVLTAATLNASHSAAITGTLTSAPATTYRIEYFSSPACDATGSGEGATFIGFSLLTTNASGTLSIDTGAGLTALVSVGDAITATATDQSTGDTSEFSPCVTVTDTPQTSPFVVNTEADHADAAGCTVDDCTLREAINAADAAPGSAIHFDLPAGQTTISPASNLPFVSVATTIDATTQPGYSGTPLVTLSGSNVSSDGIGFNVTGDGSTIRGFVITDWSRAGIDLNFSNGNTIAGNYIGIDVGGIGAQNGDGILLDQNSDNNTIGGTGPNDRNVISANGQNGINLTNGEGGTPDDNTIVGNYIGLRPDGTGTQGVSGNVSDGIVVAGDSNTIGGSTAAARNYISGNDGNGITIFGQGNAVKGNVVGLDVSGNPVANSSDGIDVVPFTTDVANVIGGPGAGDGNVISGNSEDGLFLQSPFSAAPPGTIVQGNLIGTDPSGTTAIGNGLHGIETNDGGFNQIDHNTISGNVRDGIYTTGFDSNNNTIAQNMIGTNPAGTAAIPNGQNGVEFDFASGTVDHNVISGNTLAGIATGGAEPPSTFRTITGNKIGTNAAGTAAIPNHQGIVEDGGVLDVIGGTAPGDGNLISGNDGEGVLIDGANFTSVEGNTIGLNAAGTAALPNQLGVAVENNADTITVGGSIAGARNVISGNTGDGVLVDSAGGDGGILVVGNLIGTNAAGTADDRQRKRRADQQCVRDDDRPELAERRQRDRRQHRRRRRDHKRQRQHPRRGELHRHRQRRNAESRQRGRRSPRDRPRRRRDHPEEHDQAQRRRRRRLSQRVGPQHDHRQLDRPERRPRHRRRRRRRHAERQPGRRRLPELPDGHERLDDDRQRLALEHRRADVQHRPLPDARLRRVRKRRGSDVPRHDDRGDERRRHRHVHGERRAAPRRPVRHGDRDEPGGDTSEFSACRRRCRRRPPTNLSLTPAAPSAAGRCGAREAVRRSAGRS